LGQQLSKPPPTFLERSPGLMIPPSVEQIAHKLLQREASERFQSATELVQAIDILLAPLPGHGAYRFTLADGSPQSVRGSNPSQPQLEVPLSFDFGQPPLLSPLPGSPSAPELGQAPPASVAMQTAQRAFGEVERSFERVRSQFPKPIRDAVRHVPTRALLVVSAALALMLTILGSSLCFALVHALRGKHTSATAHAVATTSAAPSTSESLPAIPGAPDSELEDAIKGGIPALEALSAKFPNDPHPVIELGNAAIAAKDYVKAVGYVGRALNVDPTVSENKQLASILFQTAQVKPASDASFALLFGPMGSHGPDIAYDLAATEVVKPWVRARADQGLRSPDFARLASKELRVAVALRFAVGCPQRYALLSRAKSDGDERALGYLNQYKVTNGCGRRHREDCFACMHHDSELGDAIAAINARAHK
jgi:hypothetical protein